MNHIPPRPDRPMRSYEAEQITLMVARYRAEIARLKQAKRDALIVCWTLLGIVALCLVALAFE